MSWCWSIFGGVDVAIGSPLRIGNTDRLLSPSVCAASRTSTSTSRPRRGIRRRASPSPAWPAWSTPARPSRSRPTTPGGPRRPRRRRGRTRPRRHRARSPAGRCHRCAAHVSDLVPRWPAPAYVRTLVPQGPVGAARPRRHRPGCRGGPRARARRAFLPGRMHPERPPAGPGVRRTAPVAVGAGSLTARKGVAQGNSTGLGAGPQGLRVSG